MSANAAAKKQKPLKRHPSKLKKMSAYMILTLILISIVAVLFTFPLYWIITGSFKTGHFGKDNLRAKGFGLSANGFCQGHSRNGGNARIIDDPLRNGNLPAKFFLFKDQDAIAGPCQIKGCRETSRAAANNKNII